MTSPGQGQERPPKRVWGRVLTWASVIVGIVGVGLLLMFIAPKIADHYTMFAIDEKIDIKKNAPPQTEAFFLAGLGSRPSASDEWWAARSDHRLIARAVLSCKQRSDISFETMPRQHFSALLLDLSPTGNHIFLAKDGDGLPLSESDIVKPLSL